MVRGLAKAVSCMGTTPSGQQVDDWLQCLALERLTNGLLAIEKNCANDGEHSEKKNTTKINVNSANYLLNLFLPVLHGLGRIL